jgi:formate dehydrogenase major subunit
VFNHLDAVIRQLHQGLPRLAADRECLGGLTAWPWIVSLDLNAHYNKNVTPQVVHVRGDPDYPTNRGTLCPKGSSHEQDMLNPQWLTNPQVRRPGTTEWNDISWDDAINEIGRWVKKSPDETIIEQDAQGRTVNRCEGISFIGGCTDTNEFNYLVVKSTRSLGLCYIENRARI